MKRALMAIAALTFAKSAWASPNTVYHYEPAKSELTGTVQTEKHYGPPNYGENPETDRIETIYVLTLPSPISIIANENDDLNATSFPDISRVQLTSGDVRLSPLIGKNVRLSGELFQGHTGHHYTDVLMWVESAILVKE